MSGRRVAGQEVSALGAGRLAPGVYLVRLTQGGASRVTRVAVVD